MRRLATAAATAASDPFRAVPAPGEIHVAADAHR